MTFEWDDAKEALNLEKHGVDFSTVAAVFDDPKYLIVPNLKHSLNENRFYAIGYDGHDILTVRYARRDEGIRIIGAGYWRKQKRAYENQK